MGSVQVQTVSKQYEVRIDSGLRHQVGALLKELLQPVSSILIVTDSNVGPYYLKDVIQSFDESSVVYDYVIESGEASKSFSVYEQVLSKALEVGLDRKSAVIALGGGVVGDLAGFVAATYMRGIRFVQMPTTLLAHDSSVGGKVAINHRLGKNMVGSFHQPEAVLYDTDCLMSLPEEEWKSGFAEVIKHGFIRDEAFLKQLEREWTSFKTISVERLNDMLARSISVKADVVSEDEQEHGIRAHLNFGHTLGHAIEAQLGYGKITHGEAVAIGMLFALRLSEEMLDVNFHIEQYENWFLQLGYRTKIPASLNRERLLQTMSKDKKVEAGTIRMVLLKKLGEATIVNIPPERIRVLLDERMEGSHG
ncbi:3-dehydroquinate synthase [Halalkalibacter sp. APA_J-10(15)]|uniref:3-dehydroquinate synthase n=1 Tax=Halalkalibacter sp. APA_J-10(15) TaxID=2933805 RepID=UPI001FF6CCD0|nr:3-dehydroquinate synthase [Halalkalibacter sp. APA_J-10(15)]MCK0472119.1 3-dehydroquinate synthase [Halalkalibacter sp. APA_J-10(15)]